MCFKVEKIALIFQTGLYLLRQALLSLSLSLSRSRSRSFSLPCLSFFLLSLSFALLFLSSVFLEACFFFKTYIREQLQMLPNSFFRNSYRYYNTSHCVSFVKRMLKDKRAKKPLPSFMGIWVLRERSVGGGGKHWHTSSEGVGRYP